MTPQSVLFIVGIVLIVAAVVMVGLAVWTYRALDIKGVRDDLSGVARARELSSPDAQTRRSTVRAFSGASWQGEARQRERAPEAASPAAAQRPHASPPPAAPAPARRAAAPAADDETSLLGAQTAPSVPFAFRVVRRELGAGTPRRIEE